MFKRIVCLIPSILTVLTLVGCVNEISQAETTIAIETSEVAIEEMSEPIVETTIPETEPATTEPEVQKAPNGDKITEILHLKIDALNVRRNPNTTSQILGCYHKGDEIMVIGRGDGGAWLKVYFCDYKGIGKIGYCSNGHYFEEGRPSNQVQSKDEKAETKPIEETISPTESTEIVKPTERVPDETEPPETTVPPVTEEVVPETTETREKGPSELALENQGSYGRLIIPVADISCQLNLVDTESSEASYFAQHYTDLEDSAAFFKYNKMHVISDHKDQSFGKLEDVKKGDVAYIGSGEDVIKLYCYKTRYGNNKSDKLFTDHNESGTGFDGYLIYTFSDTKKDYNLYMTYWREKTW